MNHALKITIGILGTILLGAIGSGLWERFLSRWVDKLVELSIQLVDLIFTTYTDSIYADAALGFHENYSLQIYILIFALMPILYYGLIRRHPIERKKRQERREQGHKGATDFLRSDMGLIFLYALTVTITMYSLFFLANISYTNRVITFSLRSIDIVAPHVEPEKTIEMKSNFYQIKNTGNFDDFYSEITEMAQRHSLQLPEFNKL